jgi:hypothetical protein
MGAYLAACIAAGLAAALLMMSSAILLDLLQGLSFTSRGNHVHTALHVTAAVGMLAAIFALLPAAVLIALAEARRQRSAVFYGIAGAVAAILAFGTMHACGLIMLAWSSTGASRRMSLLDTARMLLTREQVFLLLISCVGALAGGLVYWGSAGTRRGAPPAA